MKKGILIALIFSGIFMLVSAGLPKDGGGDDPETVNAFTQKYILTPIKESKKKDLKKEYFGRCPTGYRTGIPNYSASADGYIYGKLRFCSGCECDDITEFRVAPSKKSAELKNSKGAFVDVTSWIKEQQDLPDTKIEDTGL